MNLSPHQFRIHAQEIKVAPEHLALWHASSTVFTARMATLLSDVYNRFVYETDLSSVDDEAREEAHRIAAWLERTSTEINFIQKVLRESPHPDICTFLDFDPRISKIATSIGGILASLSDFYLNIMSLDAYDHSTMPLNTSWKPPSDQEVDENSFDTPLPPEPDPPTPEGTLSALIEVATSRDQRLNVADLIAAFGGARCDPFLATLLPSVSVDHLIVSMAAGIEALQDVLQRLQTGSTLAALKESSQVTETNEPRKDGRQQDPTLKTITDNGIDYVLMTIGTVIDLAEITRAMGSWQETLQRIKNKHPSIVGGELRTRVGGTDNFHCLFALAVPINALRGADTIPSSWLDGIPGSDN